MLNWLERRIRRIAVPNLTMIMIISQVLTFVAMQADPRLVEGLVLVPNKVLEGQIYCLFSFLVIPPITSTIWALFFWYLLYMMGTALEHYWGTARFNLFLLIGYTATVAASFLAPGEPVGNGFLQGTIFLAFAQLNPTFTLHIMLIFPIQIRWLALVTWIGYLWAFTAGNWADRLAILASVLNFLLFFGPDIIRRAKRGQRHMAKQVSRFRDRPPEYIHKCVVCGLTDAQDRNMDFRYCGKCAGDLCYCSEHLKSHEHVIGEAETENN